MSAFTVSGECPMSEAPPVVQALAFVVEFMEQAGAHEVELVLDGRCVVVTLRGGA